VEILTKPLSKEKLFYFRDKLGMLHNVSLTKRECRCFAALDKHSLGIVHGDLTNG
jgi:hypothetical protein